MHIGQIKAHSLQNIGREHSESVIHFEFAIVGREPSHHDIAANAVPRIDRSECARRDIVIANLSMRAFVRKRPG